MPDLKHLSYSSINSYLWCAAHWRFKYLDGLPTKGTPAMTFGKVWHSTLESFIKTDPAKQDESLLLSRWGEEWQAQIEKEVIEWDQSPESYCNEGIRMLSHKKIDFDGFMPAPGNMVEFLQSLKPRRPFEQHVERFVELSVPGVPLPIIGFIDFIGVDGIPCDFKTADRSWTTDKALGELQPLFYLAALNQSGVRLPGLRFRHYVFVKNKTPKVQLFEHTHQSGELVFLFQMIKNVWKGIEAGTFPENPTTWLCDPRKCDFWSQCRGKYL